MKPKPIEPHVAWLEPERKIAELASDSIPNEKFKIFEELKALMAHLQQNGADVKLVLTAASPNLMHLDHLREKHPEIPVVLISGFPTQKGRGIPSKAMAKGAKAVVQKPFNAQTIAAAIAAHARKI